MADENKQSATTPLQRVVNVLTDAENLYDAILDKLKIDQNDAVYRTLVLGILRRQTRDHLIFSIWNSLNEEQAILLRQFINQMSLAAPDVNSEDVLMDFAMLYPTLMEKINKGLTVFFQNFIKKFNEIGEG